MKSRYVNGKTRRIRSWNIYGESKTVRDLYYL